MRWETPYQGWKTLVIWWLVMTLPTFAAVWAGWHRYFCCNPISLSDVLERTPRILATTTIATLFVYGLSGIRSK